MAEGRNTDLVSEEQTALIAEIDRRSPGWDRRSKGTRDEGNLNLLTFDEMEARELCFSCQGHDDQGTGLCVRCEDGMERARAGKWDI